MKMKTTISTELYVFRLVLTNAITCNIDLVLTSNV